MSNTQTSGFFVHNPPTDEGGSSPEEAPRSEDTLDVFSAAIFDTSFEIPILVRDTNDEYVEAEPILAEVPVPSGPPAQNGAPEANTEELAMAVHALQRACEHILRILPTHGLGEKNVLAQDYLRVSGHETSFVDSFIPSAPLEVAVSMPVPQIFAPSEKIVEGLFDGTGMRGEDGKIYTVPPNYASKSKLVEGDGMKLTITPTGSFIFKQIHPVERARVIGRLEQDATTREYGVRSPDHRWHVLTASVTYYKGVIGDEVVILVPQGIARGAWGAVENIIKKY